MVRGGLDHYGDSPILDACFSGSFRDGCCDLGSITQIKDGKVLRAHSIQTIGSTTVTKQEMTSQIVQGLAPKDGSTAAEKPGDGHGKRTLKELEEYWRKNRTLGFLMSVS